MIFTGRIKERGRSCSKAIQVAVKARQRERVSRYGSVRGRLRRGEDGAV
jgi:hypothetical protein